MISLAAQNIPAHLLLYMIPQVLLIAIPVGVTWGLLCGLGGRVAAFRVKGAALALALVCSAASLATTVWMFPAANQAFRVAVFEQLRPQGKTATLAPGATEMPMSELRGTIDALTRSGQVQRARNMAFGYYIRWSLPFAPLALALFAVSVLPRRPVRLWMLAAAACGVCFAYYLLLFAADAVTRGTQLPVVALVWLPNLVFIAAAAALMAASMRSDLSANSQKRSV